MKKPAPCPGCDKRRKQIAKAVKALANKLNVKRK